MARQGNRRGEAKRKILDAAVALIRQQGFAATTVDDLCAYAGVTKGAFFHHFPTKAALGVAAAEYWAETTGELFERAPYHEPPDPLDRVLAYIDFREALLDGELQEVTCLVGTMTQEVYASDPDIRDACAASIFDHASTLEADIAAAMQSRDITADWTPASLAAYTQCVLQGAFILAKASGDIERARDSVRHLARYVALLFGTETRASVGG